MKRWTNILDLCLVLFALWCVLVPLCTGAEPEIPLPFGNHISGSLSERNLLIFMCLFWVRIHLRATEPWMARFSRGLSPWMQSVLIVAAAFVLYLHIAEHRAWPSGDTIPNKLVPISLIEQGSQDLKAFEPGIPPDRRYGLYQVGERLYSAYPIGTPLTALPVYGAFRVAIPEAFRSCRSVYALPGGDDLPNMANLMEQVSASAIAALAVVVFWLIAVRVTNDRRASLWFTAAYGVGTSLLSTASLALWQHGPACLFLGLMILLLLKSEAGGRAPLFFAGLCAGWATVCRPPAAIILAAISLWVIVRFRWKSAWFLVPAAALVAGIMAWNQWLYGTTAGGYIRNMQIFVPYNWRITLVLLFSPSRGLFVFSPFLLFAAALGLRRLFAAPLSLMSFCFYGAAATALFFSCWGTWSAGCSFGSRYLCEATLLLCLILPLGWRLVHVPRAAREAFILAVLVSCFVHILGARHGDHAWTGRAFQGDNLAAAWTWRDSQLAWTLIGGRD